MNEKEIIEGNKIINDYAGNPCINEEGDTLSYHAHWDYLIPVYSKFCKEYNKRYNDLPIVKVVHRANFLKLQMKHAIENNDCPKALTHLVELIKIIKSK